MNDVPTGKALPNKPATDWERLRHVSDADNHAAITSDPDIIPTDADFWQTAKVVTPQRKPTITIRLDPDVLAWLKEQGKGYQTRINAILRAYMQARMDNASNHRKS